MINHWFMSEDLITMNKCKGIQEKKGLDLIVLCQIVGHH